MCMSIYVLCALVLFPYLSFWNTWWWNLLCVWVYVCMFVTRRLVATGGGKQADLYSFDHPGVRGWDGWGVSLRRLEERNMWAARYICQYAWDICICTNLRSHSLPQPAVRCPVCQHCWCRGGRLSLFVLKLSACQLGTRHSSAESGLAPSWSHYQPQIPTASPHKMDYPT